jgi:hypothetical protein
VASLEVTLKSEQSDIIHEVDINTRFLDRPFPGHACGDDLYSYLRGYGDCVLGLHGIFVAFRRSLGWKLEAGGQKRPKR